MKKVGFGKKKFVVMTEDEYNKAIDLIDQIEKERRLYSYTDTLISTDYRKIYDYDKRLKKTFLEVNADANYNLMKYIIDLKFHLSLD